jgi:hypothetical protein
MKVILTGGLGNQLFQVNAALELYSGEIELISHIGKPRVDSKGNPEIVGLRLPERVKLAPPKIRHVNFASKVFGLNLRAHFAPRKIERHLLGLIRLFGNVYFSIIFRELTVIRASTNVGFSELGKVKNYHLLVGYFQSHRFLTAKTRDEINELSPISPTSTYLELKESILGFNSLIIHVRLGDYFNEPGIGILDRNYYESALAKIDLTQIDKVLVFTDSPEKVIDYLPFIENLPVEIITNELSSVETISLMALGNQYIISNSTFSWWAAAMCTNENNLVIAPSPWFEKMSSPKDLISPIWRSVER